MGQFPKGLVGLGVFTVISSLFLTVFCLFVCFFSLFFLVRKLAYRVPAASTCRGKEVASVSLRASDVRRLNEGAGSKMYN